MTDNNQNRKLFTNSSFCLEELLKFQSFNTFIFKYLYPLKAKFIYRAVLVLKCEQGFVGYKSASSSKMECNKASYETIKVERGGQGQVFFKSRSFKYRHRWSLPLRYFLPDQRRERNGLCGFSQSKLKGPLKNELKMFTIQGETRID